MASNRAGNYYPEAMVMFQLRRRQELRQYYAGDTRADGPATGAYPALRAAPTLAQVWGIKTAPFAGKR